MDQKSSNELQEHMLWTYYGLRVGLAMIGIALPVMVFLAGGALHHVWFQPSLSDYYHTAKVLGALTTRDLFVGGLFAAGACLYLYKGYSDKENWALNFAGAFAVLVALFPTGETDADKMGLISKLHGTSAILFFACIAYVSLFRSRDTLELLDPAKRAPYARRYQWTGWAMVLSPLAAAALSFAPEDGKPFPTIIFWIETLGVWAFAAYWIIKTTEMRQSEAEKHALQAALKREARPADEQAAPAAAPPAGASPGKREVERVVRA